MKFRTPNLQNYRKARDRTSLKALPKPHVFAASAVLAAMVGVILLTPAERVQAKRVAHSVDLAFGNVTVDNETLVREQGNTQLSRLNATQADELKFTTAASPAKPAAISEVKSEPVWQTETVLPGDSLSTIFQRLSLPYGS